ncbi:MAG: sigma 54-interacting transcriptional regulator [Bryobacteraceae bacterium]|nr:sigma 54-interacting transcriptional regulator [Bryobacteraceae bacterium]
MDARLAAIEGPLKGKVFFLSADRELNVGREPQSGVPIFDPSVSRRHCVFRVRGNAFTVTDLGSRNGTFVNGVPVRERTLEPGDHIRIGGSLFVFVVGEEVGTPEPEARVVEEELVARTIVQLRPQDSVYVQAAERAATLAPSERVVRDLSALVGIGRLLTSTVGLEPLEARLLEALLEVIPAERAAIVLVGPDPGDVVSEFQMTRDRERPPAMPVSRSMVRQVLAGGDAVLSNAVRAAAGFGSSDSDALGGERALLAVPLRVGDRVLGALYADAADPTARFDEGHLQFLVAVAANAAMALDHALRLERLEQENRRLREEIRIEHNMVGESARMCEVYHFVAKVAPYEATVLIRGESGTGKELVARAIHDNGPRALKPFVAIHCAALTETLLESELFGHEKGAFTGAIAQKRGKIEMADGGTLFLDEVGEIPLSVQVKLLRVLQEREFERVGATRSLKVDVRFIAATNRDLEEAVRVGAFRQDLYYRLNVVAFTLPPLRERREDIPLLAAYFVSKFAARVRRRVAGLSPEARVLLERYDWPGNVRELENAVEHAVVLGATDMILPEDLPETVLEAARPGDPAANRFHAAVVETKRRLILEAVEEAGGNLTEAARLLGLHPNYLHRLIRNMNLRPQLQKFAAKGRPIAG